MADRIFKGRLIPERNEAFPEAACEFHEPHAGGLEPFEVLYDVLKEVEVCDGQGYPQAVQRVNGSIMVCGDDAWVKIDPDGSLEIGTSGA